MLGYLMAFVDEVDNSNEYDGVYSRTGLELVKIEKVPNNIKDLDYSYNLISKIEGLPDKLIKFYFRLPF